MNIKRTLTLSMMSLLAVSTFSFAISQNREVKHEVVVAAESVESYYSSISDTLEGDDLLNALNSLNKSKKQRSVGYDGMKSFAKYCDADPDGSGKIIGFYDNTKLGPNWDSAKTWNREHVWPDARGGSKVEGDAHMPRPASVKTNSDRGSKGYSTDSYDPGNKVAYYRGVASRIIFYCAIADKNLKIIEDPLNYNGSSPANSMGRLSDMLLWNLQYLPSDTSFTGDDDLARRTELNRNDVIQTHSQGQGNRKPFIDHPEYACRIWGNTNAQTRAACASQPKPEEGKTLDSIEITTRPTKTSYNKGETLSTSGMTVIAHFIEADGSTSESNVTSFVEVSPTVLNDAGTININVSYTYQGDTKYASFTVTVTGSTNPDATLDRLTIVSLPTKKTYNVGEEIDRTGLKATVYFSDNTSRDVSQTVVLSPNKFTQAGNVTVTASYTYKSVTKSATFTVTVNGSSIIPTNIFGCNGNIVTTSIVLSSISFAGIIALIISKSISKKKKEQ